jgi:hypothetical protein
MPARQFWFPHFLWQSKIWVALAAVAMYRSQVMAAGDPGKWDPVYTGLLFLATAGIYQLHQMDYVRSHWFAKDKEGGFRLYFLLLILLLTGTGVAILITGYTAHFILPSLLALAYVSYNVVHSHLPWIPDSLRENALLKTIFLKTKYWLKPISLALAWAWVTSPPGLANPGIMAWHGMFVLAVALYFDVKDMHTDPLDGIKTPAGVLGANHTALLSVSIAGTTLLTAYLSSSCTTWLLSMIYFSGIIAVRSLIPERLQTTYFYFGVESLLFIPWIIQEFGCPRMI